MGETTIDNPKGSIFAIDLGVSMLKPILVEKLAHPSGLALSPNEKILYVAETFKNRLLKVVIHREGVYYTSVFHQFSGKFGPTALAVDSQGMIYVARFDFQECSEDGIISVINPNTGEVDHELLIQGCSEITGLHFAKDDILYATESSTNSLLKILIGS